MPYLPRSSLKKAAGCNAGEAKPGSGAYRYGFNGKENDNEVKGEGNQVAFEARIYDPRVGRFLSIDPMGKNFPAESPYSFAGNSPVAHIDYNGLFKISPYWAKRYPNLAKIVKYYLPLLKDNSRVKDAWIKASGYKDTDAGGKAFDQMVTFGEGPWISPKRRESEANTSYTSLLNTVFDGDGGGEYDGNYYPDNLMIGYSQIEAFEAAVKKGDADAIAETMFVLTSAIMHETGHYGRFKLGLLSDDDFTNEAGAQFEQYAFGERFSYRHSNVADEKLQKRDMVVLKNWFNKNKKSTTGFGMTTTANFYNYYGMVNESPVPKGQEGDITVKQNNDDEK